MADISTVATVAGLTTSAFTIEREISERMRRAAGERKQLLDTNRNQLARYPQVADATRGLREWFQFRRPDVGRETIPVDMRLF